MSFLLDAVPRLLGALPLTVLLVLASALAGLVLACFVTAGLLSTSRIAQAATNAYVGLVRGTPLLVQLFLVYYGLPQLSAIRTGVLWPVLEAPFGCALLALSINASAYLGAIIAGAIRAVPSREIEAAKAFAFEGRSIFLRVVLPHAVRLALPAFGNELIGLLKATALCSTITLMELTGTAAALASESFRPFAAYALAGAFYLALTLGLMTLVSSLEKRASRHLRGLR